MAVRWIMLGMKLTQAEKTGLKQQVVACLRDEREILKVVVFGSFLNSPYPNDLDVAIFQDTDETYFPLAMKYRKLLRPVAERFPLDVIPVRPAGAQGWFFEEIQKGEVVFER